MLFWVAFLLIRVIEYNGHPLNDDSGSLNRGLK